jgi:hypothetical protein
MNVWNVLRAHRQDRRDQAIDEWLHQRACVDLRYRWRESCLRAHLSTPVSTPLGGAAMACTPRVVHVEPSVPGRSGFLVIERPSGVTMTDLEDAASDLADGLGVWSIRLQGRGPHHVRVDLVEVDPLASVVSWLPPAPAGHLVLGVDEYGQVVSVALDEVTNMVVQGATRSGKSAGCYALLGQLAQRRARHGDVDVTGIDPTGLLLGPWGAHPRGWRAIGTDDPADRYRAALQGVVDEMDRRIATLPARRDSVVISAECPLIVVVLEEWPAVARLVGHSRTKPSPIHQLVSRLLAEGSKAGIRVVTVVQRAEADVVGTFERDQALTRLSYGCSDLNTLKMLHGGDISHDVADLHGTSPKGVALLTAPGIPLRRIRAPWIGSYGAYVDMVAPPATQSDDTSSPWPLPDAA